MVSGPSTEEHTRGMACLQRHCPWHHIHAVCLVGAEMPARL